MPDSAAYTGQIVKHQVERPRPPRSGVRVPAIETPRRVDELNLGQLGLICVQERIPSDYTSWEVHLDVDGQPARLSCVAPSEFGGVPHGLDGDIMNGILTIFLEQGSPESGEIVTTGHQILVSAGLDVGGRYYQVLHASLHRLNSAKFVAQNAWRAHTQRRWTTQTFSLVDDLAYDSAEQTLGRGSVIRIRLHRAFVQSVREKYLKPLDPMLLGELTRPLTRSVYRLLDARRYDPTDPQVIAMDLRMRLVDWGIECKLKDLVPSRIRRALEKAHTELQEHGYLEAVEHLGSGARQEIVYRFGDGTNFGMDLLSRLVRHGVGVNVAQSVVQETARDDLIHRLAKAEYLLARGSGRIQNRAGYVVSVLKDDGTRFPDPEGFVPPASPKGRVARAAGVATPAPPAAQEPAQEDVASVRHAREVELRSLSSEEQADALIARMRLLCGAQVVKLGAARIALVHQAIRDTLLDTVTVERELMTAVYGGSAEVFLQALVREAEERIQKGQGALLGG